MNPIYPQPLRLITTQVILDETQHLITPAHYAVEHLSFDHKQLRALTGTEA